MMDSYDEDLNENPFFRAFLQSYPDLFSRCVCEQWLICVPRRDSLPKYAFTLEDITHHILRPLKTTNSTNEDTFPTTETSGSSGNSNSSLIDYIENGSRNGHDSSLCGNLAKASAVKWNYRTLAHVNFQYSGTTLISDIENAVSAISTVPENNNGFQNSDSDAYPVVQYRREVLFEETFYTTDKKKYKVLCIASPLNSKVAEEDISGGTNSGIAPWNLTSLRDSIDFLWVKGSSKVLETFDVYIKSFLNNHRGLENFPLNVQKDLVETLYLKCINYATQSQIDENINISGGTPTETFIISDYLLQKFKLATETYVLNGIYRTLISSITSCVSFQDSHLNKIIRNLSELHPEDLEIDSVHWNNLDRAKRELSRMSNYSSPLGKLTCMKKTLRYLRADSSIESAGAGFLSADELLPIWVYLLIKNPLGNWMAHLEFLRNFRFSTNDQNDNENAFFIVTLEASLEHLRCGKVIGVEEVEKDVGMPCELGEIWLHSVHQIAFEDFESPLGEMFEVIRLGNSQRLEELIDEYESERKEQLIMETQFRVVDQSLLCHPLCVCHNCTYLTRPIEQQSPMESAVNLKQENGLTTLHVACIYGRPKIVDHLIGIGASLESKDCQGMTPLHFAALRGHQNALLLILHAGADIQPLNANQNTPLHLCSQNGHLGCVKAIIYYAEHSRQILDTSARNCDGDTALHFASRWGFLEIVQILVEHGAAINMTNIKHVTPLDCAHDIHILRILQKSLRRRSLIHSNHGDFINIEVVKKGEGESGLVMLISEPKDKKDNEETELTAAKKASSEAGSNTNSRCNSRRSSVVSNVGGTSASSSVSAPRSRRMSTYTPPGELGSLSPENRIRRHSTLVPPTYSSPYLTIPLARSRRTSSIISPSLESEPIIPEEKSIGIADIVSVCDFSDSNFVHNNYITVDPTETGHVRKVSVESLDVSPVSNSFAFAAASKDNANRDIRKLFTAIAVGDIPLALYYLGIPAEELDNPENNNSEITLVPICHPLCPCTKCIAKNAGLNLSLDIKNLEGYTPTMLAVQYHLTSLVKILIRFRADINCQSTFDKKTALDIARELDVHDIIELLESCGAVSSTSFTPIFE